MRESSVLSEFRDRLADVRASRERAWEASRALVAPAVFRATLTRLREAVVAAPLDPGIRRDLLAALDRPAARTQDLPGAPLKALTGLPGSKAVRALCVLFGLVPAETPDPVSAWSQADLAAFLQKHPNPFDVLLAADVASVVDLGAGDLSFAVDLVRRYLPRLQSTGGELIVHGLDRLDPGSRLGGPLHVDSAALETLRRTPGLQFRFWGGQDMFMPDAHVALWSRYTIATCQAPATPTFAYEPSRFAPGRLDDELRRTKGEFRRVRADGEPALEVLHGDRRLLFPPWKFEIRGPLALLDLLSRRGKVCQLGAVDTQVFWELLSQVIEEPAARAQDVVLTPTELHRRLGRLYTDLCALESGAACRLADLAELRGALPRVLGDVGGSDSYRFRYIEIRRGAMFDDMPAGSTARLFAEMKEETTPWWIVLVPED